VSALKDPDLHKRLADFGLSPGYQDAATFGQTIMAEQARWKTVINATGIKAE
jgi:tripartite-type tricarboxylate transporter receptor subunit TctC